MYRCRYFGFACFHWLKLFLGFLMCLLLSWPWYVSCSLLILFFDLQQQPIPKTNVFSWEKKWQSHILTLPWPAQLHYFCGIAGRLHTCDLALMGGSSCPIFLLFSPAGQSRVLEMFSLRSTSQHRSAGESRFTDLCSRAALWSLLTPESAGLCCQEVLTCTVYLCFPGGITAT